MFEELWDAFCDWAKEAWNWLKNFISEKWERIVSWWDKLKDKIKRSLEKVIKGEVVVIKTKTSIGQRLKKEIEKEQNRTHTLSSLESKEGVILCSFDQNAELKSVGSFEADSIQGSSEFDKLLNDHRNNGILRIKND